MTEQEEKKDVTQAQLEEVLDKQFSKAQDWQGILLILVLVVPMGVLSALGFSDVHILIRIAAYAILGITLYKCELWVVARRIRKTIEAMKAL